MLIKLLRKVIVCFSLIICLIFSPSLPLLATQIIDIEEIPTEQAGTYPITITYQADDGTLYEEVIYVTVHYPRTIEYKDLNEAIDAHDIELSANVFDQLTNEELIHLAGAHAWRLSDGTVQPITSIIRQQNYNGLGIHQVSFSTAKGTTVIINVVYRETEFIMQNKISYFNFATEESYFVFAEVTLSGIVLIILVVLFYSRSMRQKTNEISDLLFQKK